jgi:hypothetical protein
MGIGAGLALAVPRMRRIPRAVAEPASIFGLAAILLSAWHYDASTAFPGSAAVVPVLGTLLLVTTGAQGTTFLARGLGIRPLTALGRWSYAWYLWHWPLIGAGLLLNARLGDAWSRTTVIGVAVIGSLALAATSHRLVENPVRFAPALKDARRSLALGATLTLLPVAAGSAFLLVGDVGDRAIAPTAAAASDPVASSNLRDGAPARSSEPDPGDTDTAWAHLAADEEPMTPLQASEDRMTVSERSCHTPQEDDQVVLDCIVGDPSGDATVVLVGDSHALHWVPALHEVAQHRGWRLISATKSSCAPFDAPIWNPRFEREYDECARWRSALLAELQTIDRIDAVIISRSQGYQRLLLGRDGEQSLPLDGARAASR